MLYQKAQFFLQNIAVFRHIVNEIATSFSIFGFQLSVGRIAV